MIHPLQLRHSSTLDAEPAAWFIPGDSPARWLAELARCGLADMETRLFVIPRSVADRTSAGLLVVPGRPGAVDLPPAGLACRRIAERLFVPVDAILYPPVTDAEVRQLCSLPFSFFHPAHGLSGFEEESTLRVSHLIQPPTASDGEWNHARPGAPTLPELHTVMLSQPPTLDDVFGAAAEEIGSEPPECLPPAPAEPKTDALAKTGRNLRRYFMKLVAGAMRQVPHVGSSRTWVNGVEDWANQQLQEVSEQLEQLRNKELHRLLHLLDSDPESGLRHAIPLSSFAHRGVAPPSTRLGPRSLNFDPRRLGGGPADFWNVPPNLQDVLRRRYREMADREMQLDRHRRAAYIYAKLLGDLVSSANALKQGRLFREAAVLYEDQLKNALEAARCLAAGGWLDEAIERYEKLGRWLDVAELHERAGNRPAAEHALRQMVKERLDQHDILGAAKLVEERLHAPDEALEMLLRAWPASPQAVGCVAAAFKILARLGRPDPALARLAQFSREALPDSLALPLVAALGDVAKDFPHDRVRHQAADLSRVLIACQLQRLTLPSSEVGMLLQHLVRLAPQDRLISRDANRYQSDRRSGEQRVRRVTPPPVPGKKPVKHHRFELPRQMQWLQLRREWHWFYAIGVSAKRLTLVRGVWEGDYQSLSWECPAEVVKQGFVFEPTAEQGKAVALARPGHPPLTQKQFPAADRFFNQECLAGTPAWLPTQSLPLTIGENSVWSIHLATGRAILSCHDKVKGRLQRTVDVTEDLLNNAERTEVTHLSLAALTNGVAMALGNRLVVSRSDGGFTHIELPGQVIGLIATLPNTRSGVAVMLQQGAVMHWVGTDTCLDLDRDLPAPMGAFVPGGPLVLVTGHHAVTLEVDSRGVKSVTRMDLPGQRPIGVSATANPGEFAVLGEHGEMTLYRMPR